MARAAVGLAVMALAGCSSGPLLTPNTQASGAAPAPAAPAAGVAAPALDPAAFRACVVQLRGKAAARGIPVAVTAQALDGLDPEPKVIELDRKQPEFVRTFWQYYTAAVTPDRADKGQKLLAQHATLLRGVAERYGVAPEALVAFWGMETNYGTFVGTMPVMRSLVTLTCEGRRGAFFEEESLAALRILANGSVAPDRLVGSWAGAFGNTQFMPSTFLKYAVDADGDGRVDLWNSLPDIFGSSANYLASIGWKRGQSWGQEVKLPPGFDYTEAELGQKKPLSEWLRKGVKSVGGRALPAADTPAAIVLPAGWRGPAFAVYPNFDVILKWNRSTNYALGVGLLADRLGGKPPLSMTRPADDQPMRRDDVADLQQRLLALGFNPGATDGTLGGQTAKAIRAYQKQQNLPADGYPDSVFVDRLRGGAQR